MVWVFLLEIFLILLWGYIAYTVYDDAEKRGLPAWPWAIFVFCTGLLILLIYHLIARNYPIRDQGGFGRGAVGYGASGQLPQVWGASTGGPAPAEVVADPEFVDDYLDGLIADGRLREARAHMNDMLQVAREMNDKKGIANYRKYEKKIAASAYRSSR
jgi:hypothetical protein